MGQINKNLVINRVPLSRMLKLEVPELAEEVIKIVDKYNAEEMQINDVFLLLLGKRDEIDQLKSPYGNNHKRFFLETARQEMILHASTIKHKLRLASKSKDPKFLRVLKEAVRHHLFYLNRNRNAKVMNQKVASFLNEVETNTDLLEVISDLNLLEDVMVLDNSLKEVRDISGEVVEIDSSRTRKSTNQLKRSVYSAINFVLTEIEQAQLKHTEIDYTALIHELNVLTYKYKLQITLRDHSNKRKAAMKNGGAAEDETGDATETEDATTQPEDATEDDASTEVDATAMSDNGLDSSSKVYGVSIKKMDSPSGATNSIEPGNGSLESVEPKKATSSDNVNDEAAHSKQ